MHDVTLPDGGWFDLLPVAELDPDWQDDYIEAREEMARVARAKLPPPGPDPANPAVMAPPQEARLTRGNVVVLQCMVASWSVRATSLEGVLPWHDGSRKAMGLVAWNRLVAALAKDGGHFDEIQGIIPKEAAPSTTSTSGTSSAGDATAPLTDSGPETSSTPTG